MRGEGLVLFEKASWVILIAAHLAPLCSADLKLKDT